MRPYNSSLLVFILTALTTLFCNDLLSQIHDSNYTIIVPLAHEDLALYDFASVRTETDKSEVPPTDITKRNFQPAKKFFPNDELHFADSVKSVWIKFQVANTRSSDTSIALRFFSGVSKAVLYK